MGVIAEMTAEKHKITKADQVLPEDSVVLLPILDSLSSFKDAFAQRSYRNATQATTSGVFKPEIVPVEIKGKGMCATDNLFHDAANILSQANRWSFPRMNSTRSWPLNKFQSFPVSLAAVRPSPLATPLVILAATVLVDLPSSDNILLSSERRRGCRRSHDLQDGTTEGPQASRCHSRLCGCRDRMMRIKVARCHSILIALLSGSRGLPYCPQPCRPSCVEACRPHRRPS